MLGNYDNVYAITSRYIKFNKCKYYTWQWKWSQGIKPIKDQQIKIELNNQEIKVIEYKISEIRLGVHMSLLLKW